VTESREFGEAPYSRRKSLKVEKAEFGNKQMTSRDSNVSSFFEMREMP
jgi:hypothetical protein